MSEAHPEKNIHTSSWATGKGEQLTSFSTAEVSACGQIVSAINFSELLGEDRHEDELSDGDSDIDEPIHY